MGPGDPETAFDAVIGKASTKPRSLTTYLP